MKCANCSADAEYTEQYTGVVNDSYCREHLPVNLRVPAAQGLLPLMVDEDGDE